MQVQRDVNSVFFFFFHFFQTRCPVNNAMSHPVVRNKLWLIAVAAVILKEMGGTSDFKDTLHIKHLFEIIIILHKCDCFCFRSRQLLPFASSEFRSFSTAIENLKTVLESKHWYTRAITGV